VPSQSDLRYEITLDLPGEPRISDYRPDDFGAAVEYAIDFARKNRGVKVRVGVVVPASPLHVRGSTLFVCEFPSLEPFMAEDIKNHFGRLPH
jgi:hypothetical protein